MLPDRVPGNPIKEALSLPTGCQRMSSVSSGDTSSREDRRAVWVPVASVPRPEILQSGFVIMGWHVDIEVPGYSLVRVLRENGENFEAPPSNGTPGEKASWRPFVFRWHGQGVFPVFFRWQMRARNCITESSRAFGGITKS